jgi:GDP-L-fucose synthase
MNNDSRILVAGAKGMVGSAIVRNLESKGYTNVIEGTRNNVDFTNQYETEKYFGWKKPEYVFLAAAKAGGIMANKTYPAQFIYEL